MSHTPKSSDPVQLARRRMREAAIAHREALPPSQRHAFDRRIGAHLGELLERYQPGSLGFCWPYRCEPDLREWVTKWLAAAPGRRAALPVVLRPAAPMAFRQWTPGCTMAHDRHGIPHPVAGPEFVPDAVLAPLNAFDAAGFRLGYGGGYFDRTLANLARRPLTIGVGYECGRVDSVLPQPHDLAMDWLVTEAGCFSTGGNENFAS